ncbi:acetyl/propionyl/methylcrotonyl-CoA carboxylase subunit alpha [Egicoccus halophilus]|uniref:biotin carboxylase n=1 Tax=Egicoccus halophilus TaxID=1670830 RepID=A0A8J3EWK5_9ACTN|nr:acetyl-CoA carboxylase biotin carboxylase subunit [Egicoccus halophilus]GGI03863.1 acetyl-CoA carboxylase biotin carboxylase subunit [Egicoccus halophilus]
MFDAVLVANRGEIAIRVLRACRELGVRSVAVYSEVDRDAPHVRLADEAYLLGPAPAAESYLNIDRILSVAHAAGVDAIHPGYGFLSENADFAEAVAAAGLTFVGPPAEAIRRMGDKLSARAVALAAGVPVVPGTLEPTDDPEVAIAFGDEHGYPVAVKAMFGGGGRGMKVVRDAEQMREALEAAQREAKAAFGRGECYLERYLERPRHIEIQVLGDLDGTLIHLGERDCSLQRRHQKLVEEAPAAGITQGLRDRIGRAAIEVAREMGYFNAGTCEFLLDPSAAPSGGADDDVPFYFLEMNTRLQVEHPVTEMVTGVDLAQAQLRIASGDGMGLTQDDVVLTGHAIEARINAEEPATNFLPTPGLITKLVPPQGPWVRFDTGAESDYEVPRDYDSMIAKLIVWGADRPAAIARMRRALDELVLEGIPTTVTFHALAMRNEQFAAGEHATSSVEREWDLSSLAPQGPATAGTGDDPEPSREVTVEVDGKRLGVRVFGELAAGGGGGGGSRTATKRRSRGGASGTARAAASSEDLVAPMQGTVVKYAVAEGDTVAAGDLVAVLEAMKMENNITAHRDGTVTSVGYAAGDVVESGAVLARIEDAG